jgi:hypothetical protein
MSYRAKGISKIEKALAKEGIATSQAPRIVRNIQRGVEERLPNGFVGFYGSNSWKCNVVAKNGKAIYADYTAHIAEKADTKSGRKCYDWSGGLFLGSLKISGNLYVIDEDMI